MNCIIYSRVSTFDQDNARQISELKEYAKYKKYTLLNVFEEKITGASKAGERTEFKKLLDFIEKDKVDCVCVWELSRLGRSMIDVLNTIEFFSEKGINIHSKKENINTLDSKGKRDPITNIIISILSGFAEMERTTIKQRSISGIRQNVATGGSGTGIVKAYGYESIDKKLVVNKEEAEVIKLIFKKYLSGLGTQQIAKFLNAEEIPTRYNKVYGEKKIKQKFGIEKKGNDFNWKDGTIYSILTNSIYIGQRKHKGEIFKIESIIDDDTFNNVQTRLSSNFNKKDSNRKYDNYLKDLIICGKCGKSYFMHKRADNSDNAYKCLSKRYNEYCGNPSVNIDKLLESLLIICAPFIYSDTYQKSGDYKKKLKENYDNKEIEQNNIKREIKNINSQLDKIVKMYLEEKVSEKQYNNYKTDLTNELIKNEEKLSVINLELEKFLNLIKKSDSPNKILNEKELKENFKDAIEFVKIYEVTRTPSLDKIFPAKQETIIGVLVKATVNYDAALTYVHCLISQRSNTIVLLSFPTSEADNCETLMAKGKFKIIHSSTIEKMKQMLYVRQNTLEDKSSSFFIKKTHNKTKFSS